MRKLSAMIIGLGVFSWTALHAADSGKKEFLFVNGGYSSTSNQSDFEEDLVGFRDGLFKGGNATFLNGGGPKSQNALIHFDDQGNAVRDSQDRIQIFPSTLDYPAATKENVQAAFKDIASRKPDQVTMVFTDHGDIGTGALLWGGDDHVGFPELEKFRKTLPPQAWFKSAHFHCWAGATLVDPQRKVPAHFKDLLPFFKEYYPSRRCGLGEARDDEASQSPNAESWRKKFWAETFRETPRASLRDLKNRMEKSGQNPATPVLTSDYFVEDLREYYCEHFDPNTSGAEASPKSGASACVASTTPELPLDGKTLHQCMRDAFCKPSAEDREIDALTDKMLNAEALYYDELETIRSYWIDRYLEKTSPAMMVKYRVAQKSIEQIKAKYLTESNERKPISEEDQARIDQLTKSVLEYDQASATLSQKGNKEFEKYLKANATRKWVLANKKKYPSLAQELANKSDFSLTEFTETNDKKYDSSQKRRTELLAKRNEQNRTFIDSLFKDPQFKPLQEVYENTLECESSPLN